MTFLEEIEISRSLYKIHFKKPYYFDAKAMNCKKVDADTRSFQVRHHNSFALNNIILG